jgi:hypothetical protein
MSLALDVWNGTQKVTDGDNISRIRPFSMEEVVEVFPFYVL